MDTEEVLHHEHVNTGQITTVVEKADAQIRLKCVKLAIAAGAADNPYLTFRHMGDAETIYAWVTQGEK